MTETDTTTLTTGQSPRVQRFLATSRLRGANQPPNEYPRLLLAAWERNADQPLREQQARARAEALVGLPVYLFPDEHLVGMVYHLGAGEPVADPLEYWQRGMERVAREIPEDAELAALNLAQSGAAPGHIAWRWDWLLAEGVAGLMERHRQALGAPRDATAAEFHRGVIIALEGLLAWNQRHVEALEAALAEAAGDERARLEALLDLCRRVPAQPARNFHEAVQSFWFQYLAVMRENPYGGNSPGRLDYYLWPYLERDLAAGTTTLEVARELIDELFLRIDERIQRADGWVETLALGGSHPDGSSAVNPLTQIMVESFAALDQTHPAVYLRVPEVDAPEFVALAADYLLTGKNRAQILCDAAIVPAMTANGMPAEDARMYVCGGCMEISPHGMNSDLLFSGTCNVAKALELCLTGGECLQTGQRLTAVELSPLSAYAEFESFYAAFRAELEREWTIVFRRLDVFSEAMAEHRPTYLLSSMVMDCLERGREQQDGGARYADYGFTPLAIPNAADALYAMKTAVYDEKWLSAEELLAALRSNWEGREDLRRRLRALPKYGQQDPGADAMMSRLLGEVCAIFSAYRTRGGGHAKPIIFTFVWAPSAGAVLGATADGQLAGRPIAHGLTPQVAGMSEGLTAALGSHTGLCLDRVTGGASTMWDLDADWASPELVRSLLQSFVDLGGQIFQGNMTSVMDLIEAQERPEEYANLFVRVGGFSARFVNLDPAVQAEIIARHRHRG
jgi:trans-4-hydroxy-L-proline dehydratase